MFDERYENYLVLSTGQTLFFLHPDSMSGLDLATSESCTLFYGQNNVGSARVIKW